MGWLSTALRHVQQDVLEGKPVNDVRTHSPGQEGRNISRRGFVGWLLGFSVISTVAGVLTPIIGYLLPPSGKADVAPDRTVVGKLTDFPPNSGKVVPVGNKPVIITHPQGAGPQAFSAICTHLGCIVHWNKGGFIQSPCHDGRFNALTGAVISGPPPRPLPRYQLVVEGDNVIVGKPEGAVYGKS